ncbi:hypothetical protein MXB_452, partial [Myxobolus squamalis]
EKYFTQIFQDLLPNKSCLDLSNIPNDIETSLSCVCGVVENIGDLHYTENCNKVLLNLRPLPCFGGKIESFIVILKGNLAFTASDESMNSNPCDSIFLTKELPRKSVLKILRKPDEIDKCYENTDKMLSENNVDENKLGSPLVADDMQNILLNLNENRPNDLVPQTNPLPKSKSLSTNEDIPLNANKIKARSFQVRKCNNLTSSPIPCHLPKAVQSPLKNGNNRIYTKLSNIKFGGFYNICAVVSSYRALVHTITNEYSLTILLIDETVDSVETCVLFAKNPDRLPLVTTNSIIQIHGIKTQNYQGKMQCVSCPGYTWSLYSMSNLGAYLVKTTEADINYHDDMAPVVFINNWLNIIHTVSDCVKTFLEIDKNSHTFNLIGMVL